MDESIPIVTQAEFDKIECGRCGQCCERIALSSDHGEGHHVGPLRLLEMYGETEAQGITHRAFAPVGFMEFSGQLVPRWDEDSDSWVYTCGHFSRDEEGLGLCGIYDQRPTMCSSFPNGAPATGFSECTWNVEVVG